MIVGGRLEDATEEAFGEEGVLFAVFLGGEEPLLGEAVEVLEGALAIFLAGGDGEGLLEVLCGLSVIFVLEGVLAACVVEVGEGFFDLGCVEAFTEGKGLIEAEGFMEGG